MCRMTIWFTEIKFVTHRCVAFPFSFKFCLILIAMQSCYILSEKCGRYQSISESGMSYLLWCFMYVTDHIDDRQTYMFAQFPVPSSCVFYRSTLSFAFVNKKPVLSGRILIQLITSLKKRVARPCWAALKFLLQDC